MIDYFSYLLLNKIVSLHEFLTIYDSERHSEFFVTARKRRLFTTDATLNVLCELSQPMGKTEFSCSAKIRTNFKELSIPFTLRFFLFFTISVFASFLFGFEDVM